MHIKFKYKLVFSLVLMFLCGILLTVKDVNADIDFELTSFRTLTNNQVYRAGETVELFAEYSQEIYSNCITPYDEDNLDSCGIKLFLNTGSIVTLDNINGKYLSGNYIIQEGDGVMNLKVLEILSQNAISANGLVLTDLDMPLGGILYQKNNDIFEFEKTDQDIGNIATNGFAIGDLDGDMDMDVFAGGFYDDESIWLNDGNGVFVETGQGLAINSNLDIELGDLDGDSDLDAFIATYSDGNKVYLNDGSGYFIDSGQNLGDNVSRGVALADLDGDSDLDAFVINSPYQPNKVWLNDGNGNFSSNGQSLGGYHSYGVDLGDIDGDSDIDAFVVNSSYQPNNTWINNGSGMFSLGQAVNTYKSQDVVLVDIDDDSDLDVYQANMQQSNKLLYNDGLGNFSESGLAFSNGLSYSAAVEDFDNDSDLDIFVSNASGEHEFWVNDGSLNFNLNEIPMPANGLQSEVEAADFDNDGLIDLYIAYSKSNGYPDHVLLGSLSRQESNLRIHGVPLLLSVAALSEDGEYPAGTQIEIEAVYDGVLDDDVSVSIILNTGETVLLDSVSGSSISGTYTIGDYAGACRLNANDIAYENFGIEGADPFSSYNSIPTDNNIASAADLRIGSYICRQNEFVNEGESQALVWNIPWAASGELYKDEELVEVFDFSTGIIDVDVWDPVEYVLVATDNVFSRSYKTSVWLEEMNEVDDYKRWVMGLGNGSGFDLFHFSWLLGDVADLDLNLEHLPPRNSQEERRSALKDIANRGYLEFQVVDDSQVDDSSLEVEYCRDDGSRYTKTYNRGVNDDFASPMDPSFVSDRIVDFFNKSWHWYDPAQYDNVQCNAIYVTDRINIDEPAYNEEICGAILHSEVKGKCGTTITDSLFFMHDTEGVANEPPEMVSIDSDTINNPPCSELYKYGPGDVISINVTYSEEILQGSFVTLELNSGNPDLGVPNPIVTLVKDSTLSKIISGTYIVSEGEMANPLDIVSVVEQNIYDYYENVLIDTVMPIVNLSENDWIAVGDPSDMQLCYSDSTIVNYKLFNYPVINGNYTGGIDGENIASLDPKEKNVDALVRDAGFLGLKFGLTADCLEETCTLKGDQSMPLGASFVNVSGEDAITGIFEFFPNQDQVGEIYPVQFVLYDDDCANSPCQGGVIDSFVANIEVKQDTSPYFTQLTRNQPEEPIEGSEITGDGLDEVISIVGPDDDGDGIGDGVDEGNSVVLLIEADDYGNLEGGLDFDWDFAFSSDPDCPTRNKADYGNVIGLSGVDDNTSYFTFQTNLNTYDGCSYNFVISVTDEVGQVDLLFIEVEVDNINIAPLMEDIGDVSVEETDTLTIIPVVTDPDWPDYDEHYYTWTLISGDPVAVSNVSLDPITGEFVWIPASTVVQGSEFEEFVFGITVSDSYGEYATDMFGVKVTNKNTNPEFISMEQLSPDEFVYEGVALDSTMNLEANAGEEFKLEFVWEDADGDEVTISCETSEGASCPGTLSGDIYTWTPAYTDDTITLVFEANDGMGGSDTIDVTIQLNKLPRFNKLTISEPDYLAQEVDVFDSDFVERGFPEEVSIDFDIEINGDDSELYTFSCVHDAVEYPDTEDVCLKLATTNNPMDIDDIVNFYLAEIDNQNGEKTYQGDLTIGDSSVFDVLDLVVNVTVKGAVKVDQGSARIQNYVEDLVATHRIEANTFGLVMVGDEDYESYVSDCCLVYNDDGDCTVFNDEPGSTCATLGVMFGSVGSEMLVNDISEGDYSVYVYNNSIVDITGMELGKYSNVQVLTSPNLSDICPSGKMNLDGITYVVDGELIIDTDCEFQYGTTDSASGTFVINGNLIVNKNLTYDSQMTNWEGNGFQVPSVMFITYYDDDSDGRGLSDEGNIIISGNVTEMVGGYLVFNNDLDYGKFETGYSDEAFSLTGFVMANNFNLLRYLNTVTGDPSTDINETFISDDARFDLNPPPGYDQVNKIIPNNEVQIGR